MRQTARIAITRVAVTCLAAAVCGACSASSSGPNETTEDAATAIDAGSSSDASNGSSSEPGADASSPPPSSTSSADADAAPPIDDASAPPSDDAIAPPPPSSDASSSASDATSSDATTPPPPADATSADTAPPPPADASTPPTDDATPATDAPTGACTTNERVVPAGWIVHPFTDFSVAFPPDWIIDFWNDRPVHDKGALADGGAHAPSTTSSCRVTERAAGSSTMDDDIKGDQSYYALRPSLGCTSTYEKTTWQCLPELRVTTTCSGDPAYPPFHVSVIVYASAGEYAVSCDQGASDDWTVTPAITRTLDALAR